MVVLKNIQLLSGVPKEIQYCSTIARLFPGLVPKIADESGYESWFGGEGKGRRAVGWTVPCHGAQSLSHRAYGSLPGCVDHPTSQTDASTVQVCAASMTSMYMMALAEPFHTKPTARVP